jgi:WD40 repeat protein
MTRLSTPILVLLLAAPAWPQMPQNLRVHMRFLAFQKAEILQPATITMRVEIVNPGNEPRWLLAQLLERGIFPPDGAFAAPAKDEFPVQCLKFSGGEGKGHAVLVHFQGAPPFDALLLPPKAKVVFETLRLDAAEANEFTVAEAAALLVDGKLPLEKWLALDLNSSMEAVIAENAKIESLLVDPASGRLRDTLPKEPIRQITAKVEGKRVVAVEGYNRPPVYFEQGKFHEKKDAQKLGPWRRYITFEPTGNLRVEGLAFAPDGKRLLASLQHLKIAGLDLDSGREIVFDAERQGFCRLLAVTREGQLWVRQMRGLRDRNAHGFLDLASGARIQPKKIDSLQLDWVKDGTPSRDRKRLALSDGTEAYVWDMQNDQQRAHFKMADRPDDFTLMSLVFSPDERYLAGCFAGTKSGAAVLWDLASNQTFATIRYNHKQSPLHLLVFAPDGKSLALATRNASEIGIVDLDRVEDGPTRTLPLHEFSVVHALAFSPDGRFVAAHAHPLREPIDPDRGPILWTSDGKRLGQLTGLQQPALALAFSADSRLLAAGDSRGNVLVWKRDDEADAEPRRRPD